LLSKELVENEVESSGTGISNRNKIRLNAVGQTRGILNVETSFDARVTLVVFAAGEVFDVE
jgi:hypothetical protein